MLDSELRAQLANINEAIAALAKKTSVKENKTSNGVSELNGVTTKHTEELGTHDNVLIALSEELIPELMGLIEDMSNLIDQLMTDIIPDLMG